MLRFTPRKPIRPAMQLTSLIDMVFLLLIFFLLTSRFIEQQGIPIDLPRTESKEAEHLPDLVVDVDRDGQFHFAGKPLDPRELRVTLMSRLSDAADGNVYIRADRDVRYDAVVEAMDIARLAGARQLLLVTERKE